MARIEGIAIQNYGPLKDVTIGKTFEHQHGAPLPSLLAFIGPNGSGKSTLLDAFVFLRDCLADGVEEACERGIRGGFERLRTKGATEPIKLELYYRETDDDRPISYSLVLELKVPHGTELAALGHLWPVFSRRPSPTTSTGRPPTHSPHPIRPKYARVSYSNTTTPSRS